MAKRPEKKLDELRTQAFNLLMCKMRISDDSKLFFDFRREGREGSISLEDLREAVNSYCAEKKVNIKL